MHMKKTIEKYGIGIFVQPPVLPEKLGAELHITAPEGVAVSCTTSLAVINVPPGFVSDEPIRIVTSGRAKIVMAVEKDARITIEEASAGDDRDLTLDLHVSEKAEVSYRAVQDAKGADFAYRRAWVSTGGRLTWQDIAFGGSFGRSFVKTRLIGERAEVEVKGHFFGTGEQELDIFHQVLHEASRTRSDLSTRGVLNGSAKTVYRGLIRIEEGAVGCVGRQKEDTLLLSDKAEIDAVPNLEIANDDVQCSHAATTGRLDDEKLFYLMSRGLDRQMATHAYVEGFIGIEDEVLRERIMKKLDSSVVLRLACTRLAGDRGTCQSDVVQIPDQVGNDKKTIV